MADPQGRKWHDMLYSGKGAEAAIDIIINFGKGTISRAIMPLPGTPAYRGTWQETIKAAGEDKGHARIRVRPCGPEARSQARHTLGANPYKFGMIGSSDAHIGLAMEEENFFSKTTPQEPSPERMTKAFFNDPRTGVKIMDWEVPASGYAAVWATENTREALFDAMERRETYATTGPHLLVRFFGDWDFAPQDAQNRLPAELGYTKIPN
jgi:hypothetical protein